MSKALIVVDVQNDFAHPDGSLAVAGGEDVVRAVNGLLEYYENVVYTRDFHPPVTSHFVDQGGPWPAHCVAGTWGAEYHPFLNVLHDAEHVKKGMCPGEDGYSGFYAELPEGGVEPTSLNNILVAWGIDSVDIVGIALDVCVRATALDAYDLGYNTRVIVGATAPVTREGGQAAIDDLLEAGVKVV